MAMLNGVGPLSTNQPHQTNPGLRLVAGRTAYHIAGWRSRAGEERARPALHCWPAVAGEHHPTDEESRHDEHGDGPLHHVLIVPRASRKVSSVGRSVAARPPDPNLDGGLIEVNNSPPSPEQLDHALQGPAP
jgi:hypothetical protein